jgi:NTE family protein
VFSTVTTTPMANYSFDTVELVRTWMEQTGKDIPELKFYPVYVGFSADPDQDERKHLNAIGTNFSISKEQIDLLVTGAARILDASPQFQQLKNDLQ